MDSSALHVLIVDDSPEDRLIVRRLLTRSSPGAYIVTEVDRGGFALAACQSIRPDCVLLDHSLPDMDGLEVLVALRAESDVPVVVLTGAGNVARTSDRPPRDRLASLDKGTLTAERLSLTIRRAIADVQVSRTQAHDLALLTTMIDVIPVGVSVLDQELRFLQMNAAMATLLGYPAVTLRGQRFADLWPDMARALAPHCAQVLATSTPAGPYAVLAPRPNTGISPHNIWQASVQPLALPDMGTTHWLCVVIH
ncbi:MAG: response regulator [Chloroflexales bacterium]